MSGLWRWLGSAVGVVIIALILIMIGSWLYVRSVEASVPSDPPPAPLPILWAAIPNGPQADQLRLGRRLVIEGDCASCHTRRGGEPFAGGLGLKSPFGTIFSANITSDRVTGLGAWSNEDFYRALSRGLSPDRGHLYPAFPYPHFSLIPRANSDAMLAWLKTVPAVHYRPPGNLLPFPFNIRLGLIGWNALFFRPAAFHDDRARSPAWNRGAYLVQGPEHCGACHTPLNVAGAEKQTKGLRGSELNRWVAPNLTGARRTGLGRWSVADIVEYLRTGRNTRSNAAGPMAEVVSYSTSLLPDSDLTAIATYLKSLPAGPETSPSAADPAATRRGAAVYSDACASCHLANGAGQPRFIPRLPGSAVAQQANPDGLLHIILAGARTAPTLRRPSALTMPSFAWKLDDQEAADVATYVRNSWNNRAGPVDRGEAAAMRHHLRLTGKQEAP